MIKKHIVIITHYFAPMNEIAAVRMTKFAKYFALNGWKVSVITVKPENGSRVTDQSEFASIYRIGMSGWFNAIKSLFKSIKRPFKKQNATARPETVETGNIKGLSEKLKTLIWTRFGYGIFKRIYAREGADLILSSYGPIQPHFLAEKIKLHYPSVVWQADFRDSYIGNVTYSKDEAQTRATIQSRLMNAADYITVVSDGIRRETIRLFPETESKIHRITNGFDPDDQLDMKPDSVEIFSILYVGRLYIPRSDPSPLFEVISELIDEEKIEADKIRFVYCGQYGEYLAEMTERYGIRRILDDRGSVSRSESLRLQRQCHLLLVLSWNTVDSQGIITGKIFEYMLAEKPVTACISGDVPGSELKEIITQAGLGFAFEQASADQDRHILKDFVLSKYNEFYGNGKVDFNPRQATIREYEYNSLVNQIIKIYEKRTGGMD